MPELMTKVFFVPQNKFDINVGEFSRELAKPVFVGRLSRNEAQIV